MSTAAVLGAWKPYSDHNPIPAVIARPATASAQAGRGQFISIDGTYARAHLNDGATPNELCVGNADYSELSDTSSVASAAWLRCSQRTACGFSNGTTLGSTGDVFADTDFGAVAWIGDENTVGKLSHAGADGTLVNRSIAGIFLGLDSYSQTPVILPGVVGALLGRAVHQANTAVVARDTFALSGSTTRTECILPRSNAAHARVLEVRIATNDGITADNTNYWTIAISKRTATTPGSALVIAQGTTQITGTYKMNNTKLAQVFQYVDMTLITTAGYLDILEDDVLTVTCTAASSAPAVTQLVVEVIAKVQ